MIRGPDGRLGWGRGGWIKAYRGEAAAAREAFRIARALAPADPLNFLWAVGIAFVVSR